MDVIIRDSMTKKINVKNTYGNFNPNNVFITEDDHVIIEIEEIVPQRVLQEEFNNASQL